MPRSDRHHTVLIEKRGDSLVIVVDDIHLFEGLGSLRIVDATKGDVYISPNGEPFTSGADPGDEAA